MTTVATIAVEAVMHDKISGQMRTLSDQIRFIGARMRNAGIGLTIATAPFAIAIKSVVQDAMEFEAVSRGIAVVSKATGRNVADVLAIIKKHSGELMTELDLTRGVLKLLSTSLTEVQIDQFIQMVKDGSAAMGEDMSKAFDMVSKGLKTYRMQNFDLIGVNARMIEIYKKVNKSLNDTSKAYIYAIDRSEELTSEQKDAIIEQTIFNEVQGKSAVFTGIFAEYLRSTTGKVSMLTTNIKDLSKNLGTFMLPHVDDLVDKLGTLVKRINDTNDNIKSVIGNLLFFSTIIGVSSAVVLMFGGNLIWSIGQLLHLKHPLMAVGILILALPYLLYKVVEGIYDTQQSFWSLAETLIETFEDPLKQVLSIVADFVNNIGSMVVSGINKLSKLHNKFVDITGVGKKWGDELKWESVTTDKLYNSLLNYTKIQKQLNKSRLATHRADPLGTRTLMNLPFMGNVFGAVSQVPNFIGTMATDMANVYGKAFVHLIPGGGTPFGGEGGAGTGITPTPSFAPPIGGMPTGNLIIILPPTQGSQYGSQLNLGAWSSLIEQSGQDTIINAGTMNKPII